MGSLGYLRAFENLPREHGFEPLEVKGTIPSSLKGTLFANGPSLRTLFDETYPHWFDGDGGVCAIQLDGQRAQGAVRLVQTPALDEERRRSRMLFGGYRRQFNASIFFRGVFKRAKNAANTSVLYHCGRLYALWEGGRPTEIDPETLETLGERTFDDQVRMAYSAHPKVVDGEVFSFGLRMMSYPTRLDIFHTDRAGRTRTIASPALDFPTMIHDFAITERFLIFFVSPLRLRLFRTLLGVGGFDQNLHWEPERGTEVLVVDRAEPQRVTRYRTEPFMQFHFAHAFEAGDDIVVDFVRFEDFQISEWIAELYKGVPMREAYGVPTRAVLTPKSERAAFEPLWDHPCEFPVSGGISGNLSRPSEAFFCAHQDKGHVRVSTQDRIARLELESGRHRLADVGPGRFPCEPRLVRTPEGRYLLSVIYDQSEHRSFLGILDATSLELLAECWFDQHIPPRFHSTFVAR